MSQANPTSVSFGPTTSNAPVQRWGDTFGMVASIGCAIHCAATPVLLALLPTWGFAWLAHEAFHQWMFLACFLIAVIAFLPGLRRHGSFLPLGIGCFGLVLIGFAAFVPGIPCACHNHDAHAAMALNQIQVWIQNTELTASWNMITPWITPIGGGFLAAAHLVNHRKGCECQTCSAEPASNTSEHAHHSGCQH